MRERGNAVLRFLDRYWGIPLIWFLGKLKKKQKLGASNRLGILVSAGIGDTVLLSAILQDLKGREIILFTGKANYEMARMLPEAQVVVLPITRPWAAIAEIRRHVFDVWIDANPWPRINALLTFFSRSSFKIGFERRGQYRHYIYDHAVEHLNSRHELDNLRALIHILGIKGKHRPFISMKGEKRLQELILLHLFAGGSRAYLKEWPDKNWIDLIDTLSSQGYCFVLTGSAKDEERLLAIQARCKEPERIEVAAGKISLQETAFLLKRVGATVSVDTGIMHLAAAVGSPLVSLHGPTSPSRWGAIGDSIIALQWEKPYTPCIQLGFESTCDSNPCMQGIKVSSVLSALSTLLNTD
jgi:heptosyltransferase I